MKAIREDAALRNFYTRVRKRSSAKIARVAVARKLAEICWKRLRRWQREHAKPGSLETKRTSRTSTAAVGPQKGLARRNSAPCS